MDPSEQHDIKLTALLKFHAAKCRLAAMLDARQRRGEPTEDLDVEMAFNRVEARAFAASLRADLCDRRAGLDAGLNKPVRRPARPKDGSG